LKNNFIGYIEGYICMTGVDSHGDRILPEFIDNLKKQIDQNPALKKIIIQHNIKDSAGEIIEYRVVTKGRWKGLWAKIGIYQKRKDIWERIEKGEITGFSIEAKTADFNYDKQNSIFLKITSKYWHDVKNILDESNVISEVFLKKSLDTQAVIAIMLPVSLFIIDKIFDYWKIKQKEDPNTNINITIENNTYNFNNYSPQEIKEQLNFLQGNKNNPKTK